MLRNRRLQSQQKLRKPINSPTFKAQVAVPAIAVLVVAQAIAVQVGPMIVAETVIAAVIVTVIATTARAGAVPAVRPLAPAIVVLAIGEVLIVVRKVAPVAKIGSLRSNVTWKLLSAKYAN